MFDRLSRDAIQDATDENRRCAWLLLGRLILAGLLELPNFDDPESIRRLLIALNELVYCIREDE
jgi:hypothetical protein